MDEKNYERVSASYEKCRLLSYQLFGPPTNSLKSYNGPCVDLSKKLLVIPNQKNLSSNVINSEVNYCLICCSNNIENKLDSINLEDLNKFLKIITTPVKKSSFTLNDNESENINTQHDIILQQLADTTLYLCGTCNAACKNLLQMYDQMNKLEMEVKMFKAKFINVVKLSKSIFENNKIPNNTDVYNKTIDQIRTFLVGGELTLNTVKEERLNDVGFDMEESITEELSSNEFDTNTDFSEDVSIEQNVASYDDNKKSAEKMETNKL